MDLEAFFEVVKHFNRTFDAKPDLDLRLKLVQEEVDELIHAHAENDATKIAKEWADVLFVVLGWADAMKIDIAHGLNQVSTKNWMKCQNKDLMTIRADGKVTKPDGDERFT